MRHAKDMVQTCLPHYYEKVDNKLYIDSRYADLGLRILLLPRLKQLTRVESKCL